MPGHFQYHLFKDPTITGNFEVTIHNSADLSGEGAQCHSKQATKNFPSADWDNFHNLTKDALENL